MVSTQKILFVQHCSVIGGGSWCLFEILRHLDRNRFEPFVLLCQEGPLVDRIRSLGIPVAVFPRLAQFPVYERGGLAGQVLGLLGLLKLTFSYPRSFSAFQNYCANLKPDVVHLNSLALLTLAWPAKSAGVRTVLLHNREHWEPKGALRIKNLLKNFIVGRYVDRILSITECGIRHLGFPGKSLLVRDWPSFDDESSRELRKEIGARPDQPVLLVPGGMQSIKGTLDVLNAWRHMKSADRAIIVVLGCREIQPSWWKSVYTSIPGAGFYAYRIARFAREHSRVYLLPSTLQVKSSMEQSDVVICPFRFPHAAKAALEAQSVGRPVILADSEEAREYVRNGETGLIYPAGKVKDLAAAVDRVVSNPAWAKKIGKTGAIHVESGFSMEESTGKLAESFEVATRFTPAS